MSLETCYVTMTEFKLDELVSLSFPKLYCVCHTVIRDILSFFDEELKCPMAKSLEHMTVVLLNQLYDLGNYNRRKIVSLQWGTIIMKVKSQHVDIMISNGGFSTIKPSHLVELINILINAFSLKAHKIFATQNGVMKNPSLLVGKRISDIEQHLLNLNAFHQLYVSKEYPQMRETSHGFVMMRLEFIEQ